MLKLNIIVQNRKYFQNKYNVFNFKISFTSIKGNPTRIWIWLIFYTFCTLHLAITFTLSHRATSTIIFDLTIRITKAWFSFTLSSFFILLSTILAITLTAVTKRFRSSLTIIDWCTANWTSSIRKYSAGYIWTNV